VRGRRPRHDQRRDHGGAGGAQEAAKDAADRASIVAALERQLTKGDKALVSNTGFRRYLKTISEQHFTIDPDKIEQETNTDLNPSSSVADTRLRLWRGRRR
jgi:hypothetical protein